MDIWNLKLYFQYNQTDVIGTRSYLGQVRSSILNWVTGIDTVRVQYRLNDGHVTQKMIYWRFN